MDHQHQDQNLDLDHHTNNKSIDQTILKTHHNLDLDLDHHINNKRNDQTLLKTHNLDHGEVDHHINNESNDETILKTHNLDLDLDHRELDHHTNNKSNEKNLDLDNGLDQEDGNINGKNTMNYEPDPFYCTDNDPPESYSLSQTKVSDWLDHNQNTFIERNPSVKFACCKNQDSCQTTSSRRSVSTTPQPKLSIIGFRKTPVHQMDPKTKQNDKPENVRLFRNRSEPGMDYCLLITEPVSPRVSCVGRVGSVRVVRKRKTGVWRSFKAAFTNLIQTNKVTKIAV